MERKRYSEHVEALRGRSVVILANNDDAGKQYAKKAAEQLCPLSHGISITEKLWLLSTLLKNTGASSAHSAPVPFIHFPLYCMKMLKIEMPKQNRPRAAVSPVREPSRFRLPTFRLIAYREDNRTACVVVQTY